MHSAQLQRQAQAKPDGPASPPPEATDRVRHTRASALRFAWKKVRGRGLCRRIGSLRPSASSAAHHGPPRLAPRSRLLAEEVSGPTLHCLLLALWIRRRRADSEIQGSSFGRVDRCVFRIWPARATPSASRAAASANARIGRATRPQLTAHVGSAGFIGKSAIWRPPATRSGTRAPLSKWTGMNGGGDRAQWLRC